jgi:hypothetical protein
LMQSLYFTNKFRKVVSLSCSLVYH